MLFNKYVLCIVTTDFSLLHYLFRLLSPRTCRRTWTSENSVRQMTWHEQLTVTICFSRRIGLNGNQRRGCTFMNTLFVKTTEGKTHKA